MLFSSIPFLYYFLPAVMLLYFLVPKKLRNSVLFLSSMFFYAWGEPRYVWFMLFSITQGYLFGLLIERFQGQRLSKVFLTSTIAVSLGLLGYCKYANFFLENFHALTGVAVPVVKLALPIGISFYTFQIVSYTIDVYRGDVKAQRNYIHLAAYISMFPQLIAGPIVRYSDIDRELAERITDWDKAAEGIRRFVIGLSKKILIANLLGELVAIFKASDEKSLLFYWVYAIAFSLHIYFDFSGYSDMAIGLGRIFGFHFPENFRYPFISGSITEFWRRWHISLGSWFRDYLYIPLGGNRVNRVKWVRNLFLVWMATGLWHGAEWNFVLWGLYFAVLLMLEKLFLLPILQKHKVFSHIYVLVLIVINFVIFDASGMTEVFAHLAGMFGLAGAPVLSPASVYYLRSFGCLILIAVIGATPLPKYLVEKVRGRKGGEKILAILEPVYLAALLIACTAFLIDGSFNPFLYFRF